MSGFPGRPARSHFGPTYRNARPVLDPTKELGAQAMNLMAWQLAGAGRTVPLAVLILNGAGVLQLQQLAFDPRGKLSNVATSRTSAGLYTITFPTAVPDESGLAIALPLRAAIVSPQASSNMYGVAAIVGSVITTRTFNAAGAATDAVHLVQVW